MRRGMRKMKQIFLHYHPRSVTMQPVHTCVRVRLLFILLLLLCRFREKSIYSMCVWFICVQERMFLLPPQEFRVDMGSMFDRCVDAFV